MISFKEEMLCELLDCGTCDLDMLESCNYSFDDILDKVDTFTTREEMRFNDILLGAIYVYMENINNVIVERQNEIEQLKELDIYNDIEYYLNYLDTSMYIYDEDKRAIYKEFLSDIIEQENEKIGFCRLDLED